MHTYTIISFALIGVKIRARKLSLKRVRVY